jgi:hypothetical protein
MRGIFLKVRNEVQAKNQKEFDNESRNVEALHRISSRTELLRAMESIVFNGPLRLD